ncbi:MAG: type I-E CRISPR-associated protein Cas7/Cse4/CasC [Anaerolineaceae bacterium]|nr:type I-E CRISPR-associated protein Cas7/Cse4/CasC [Anaerolineaceae bacterium]
MFIELHLIQNFAPSNLNRDDTNNPKDCEFGGHRRARISSQSFKRAMRYEPVFGQTTQAQNGERSKWMSRPLKEKLIAAGKSEEDAANVAAAFVNAYAAKPDKSNPEKSSVLLYFSQEEIDATVDGLLENWDEAVATAPKSSVADLVKNLQKETKERTSAPDIALFGRMLAEKPELNIDAACQVAHAISTHRINMEMDFYTAVDDLQNSEQDEGAGAGMMGFTSFNSACFYRYARIDWNQLKTNLGWRDENDAKNAEEKASIQEKNQAANSLAQRTVEGFLRAAIDAIPTGKQNSFAAQNPTSLAMAVVREDGRSWNLANAFEKPVTPKRNSGLIEPSVQALDQFWGELTRARDDASFKTVAVHTVKYGDALEQLQAYQQPTLSGWINAVNKALPQE